MINQIAPELVIRGHAVSVLTGLPNYPEGVILKEYRHGRRRNETIEGVNVIRCFETGRGKSKVKLLFGYLSYAFSASIRAKRLNDMFDVILVYQTSPVLMAYPATVLKKKRKIPILLYCLDIWPESAQAHVRNDRGILYKFIAKISGSIYRQCDRIAVTSKPFISYMKRVNGIAEGKMSYLPQHGDGCFLNMNLDSIDNSVADFMFAGNLGHGQTLEVIIQAAAILKERQDFLIHLVGEGSRQKALESLARELGVADKVVFHGRFPTSDMAKMYRMADALLITLRGNNEVGNTMPGKLQAYMTVGKPIFGAINGAANEVITESGCGACVASGDSKGLATLMLEYIEHPERFIDCGKKAKDYFTKHFTLSIFLNGLENELLNTINMGQNKPLAGESAGVR